MTIKLNIGYVATAIAPYYSNEYKVREKSEIALKKILDNFDVNFNSMEMGLSSICGILIEINKFMNKLGIGKATEDLGREKMIQMLGKDGAKDFYGFTNYMKSISDIPVSDTSTFLQRRFTLGSLGSVAGGLFIGGAAFSVSPFAPMIFLLMARRAGLMLTDPTALRYMNDALLPEEQIKLLKGKSFALGLAFKKFSHFLNTLLKRLNFFGKSS